MFHSIASCMVTGGQEEEVVDIEHSCNCSQDEDEAEEKDLPTVPRTSHIWLGDHMPYALIDTGAGPNLVKMAWRCQIGGGKRITRT